MMRSTTHNHKLLLWELKIALNGYELLCMMIFMHKLAKVCLAVLDMP